MGGAQENTLITCKLLAERGHEVTLITGPAIGPEGELFNQTQNQKYSVIVIDEMIRAIHPIKDHFAYHKVKALLRQIQPDIVHTHSAKAGILGRFAAAQLKTQNSKLKTIHTIHGLAFHPYQNALTNAVYIAFERMAARWTDAFISVADAMTQQAIAAGIGRPEQFTTAYSAIEEDDFLTPLPAEQIKAFRTEYKIPQDAIVLITVARLAELKGHEYIIESAKTLAPKFPDAVWLFVGDGALTDELKQRIAAACLTDKFRFTGLLPPSKIPLAIQASDILVHCSLREGLARAIPQAMLCGKPVVSFDVDGAREVVNENTGMLIPPKDIEKLTTACDVLIADKGLRERLGNAARESIIKKFAPDTMVDIIESVYKKSL